MGLFGKKKDKDLSDDLLAEIEKEVGSQDAPTKKMAPAPKPLPKLPPMPKKGIPTAPKPPAAPKPPVAPKPMKKPETKMEKPALSTEDVAKLPLFMKVKEYDKIVRELKNLTESLKGMDETLNTMNNLEKEEEETTLKWKDQLNNTKQQLHNLVAQMPETGRMKDVLKVQKKKEKGADLKKEFEELKQNIKQFGTKPDPAALKLSGDMGQLKNTIQGLQGELKTLNNEFKSLSEKVEIKKEPKEKNPTYVKSNAPEPWK